MNSVLAAFISMKRSKSLRSGVSSSISSDGMVYYIYTNMRCLSSGFVLGGYRQELEGETFKETCPACLKKVDVVPIDPEPRTDIYKDGRTVMVVRKQMVDHEFGSVCAMRWRRDYPSWLFLLSIIFMVVGFLLGL